MTADLTIEVPGVRYDAMELHLPAGLGIHDWAAIGRKLCRMDQVTKWWIGDWAAFGEKEYGSLKDFANSNGINYQTLRNLAWVSDNVELSRRRDKVEWSKHAEVAALPAKEQDKWLEEAETQELPISELRKRIRQSHGESNALESDGPVIKFACKWCDDLTDWLKKRPPEWWNDDLKRIWKERLRPLVEFWGAL